MSKTLSAALACLVALGSLMSSSAYAEAPLSKIVTPALLGTTLKYAEYQIGVPAMHGLKDGVGIRRNLYERDNCTIFLGLKDNKVVSVGAQPVDPWKGGKCDIDVSEIVKRPAKVFDTTFRDYAWRGTLHFTSPQIPSCNSCNEGGFNAMIDGVGVLNNIDIRLIARENDGFSKWNNYLYDHGIDGDVRMHMPMTGDNCPLRRFDRLGFQLLQNTPVIGIEYGRYRSLQPQCNGEAVTNLELRNLD